MVINHFDCILWNITYCNLHSINQNNHYYFHNEWIFNHHLCTKFKLTCHLEYQHLRRGQSRNKKFSNENQQIIIMSEENLYAIICFDKFYRKIKNKRSCSESWIYILLFFSTNAEMLTLKRGLIFYSYHIIA